MHLQSCCFGHETNRFLTMLSSSWLLKFHIVLMYRLESTTALSILNGPKSFFVTSRLIAEVNEFFKNTGHTA